MTPHPISSTRSFQFTGSDYQAVREQAQRHLPLSVWLAAADTETVLACGAGCCVPVSGPLARQLVSACTRLGETVIHIGATDHQVISAALSMGCRASVTFSDSVQAGVVWTRLTRSHPEHDLQVADLRVTRPERVGPVLADLAGAAALVLIEQTCTAGQPATAGSFDVESAGELVKPGGYLAVITGLCHAENGVVDPAPGIIARARQVGLLYLQHIIALRVPARGERSDPVVSPCVVTMAQKLRGWVGPSDSARVHSDLLLFTKPASSAPAETKDRRARAVAAQGDPDTTVRREEER
ncbi:hypothetical protein ACIBQX_47650 [Nonomuraea sp. NPDC049714]|uniref:hypothetical protein n=1 Tax=Nonomuraea sp. NPDC049714 TaxID=3364357 RepID=UPI00379D43FB